MEQVFPYETAYRRHYQDQEEEDREAWQDILRERMGLTGFEAFEEPDQSAATPNDFPFKDTVVVESKK